MDYASLIRTIPDFPKAGILFRDLTPLFSHANALQSMIQDLAAPFQQKGITQVVGIEARGFIVGSLLASALHAGFIPVRKPGKLPATCLNAHYSLEYGVDSLQIHFDALHAQDKVLLADDLVATGGTALAAIELIRQLGAELVGMASIIDLPALGGSSRLKQQGVTFHHLVDY